MPEMKYKNFHMVMPDSMHKRLRIRAAIKGVTVTKLMMHILEQHFGLKNKNFVDEADNNYVETDE